MSDYITIPLSKRGKSKGKFETIVSHTDNDLTSFNWSYRINHSGKLYVQRRIVTLTGQKQLKMHRVILSRILERELTSDEQVDHINGDSLDNRRENLRLVNNAQNQWNAKIGKNNKSGHKGVHWNAKNRKWVAEITIHRKKQYLGSFVSKEDAYKAYCEKAVELFGEYARLD